MPFADTVGTVALVLLATLLVPIAAEKLRVPSLAALALAGALIGPFGLGLPGEGRAVGLLGEIGLLYAFLLAGAGLDFVPLRKGRAPSALAAVLSFAIPFGSGAAAASLLFGQSLLSSVLVGAAFAARSAKPYPAAAKLGLARSRSALAAAGGASLSETLAVAALAAAGAAHAGSPFGADWPLRLGLGLGAAALLWLLLPLLASAFFKRVRVDGSVEFVFVLATAFLCAFAAERSGLPSAVGAFFAGLLLRRFVPESSDLSAKLGFAGGAFFLPFFLVYAGMNADLPGLAAAPGALLAALATFGLLLAARALSSLLELPILRFTGEEAAFGFGLSLNQGAAALGILLAGLRLGLVDGQLFGGALLVVVAAGVVGPVAAKAAGARLALRSGSIPAGSGQEPERVMVALSNPATLQPLVDLAFLLRGPDEEEAVHPLAVAADSGDAEAELVKAENLLAKAMVLATRAGVPVKPATRLCVNVPEGILQAADEIRARILVVGWNRAPRLSSAFFGSVIDRVVQGGRELVVVARAERPLKGIAKVVLLLPPLAERHPGFGRGVAALGSLLARSGAHLAVYAQSPHGAAAKSVAARLKARGQTQVVEIESWKSAPAKLRAAASGQTAFAIFCSRPGGPAWHPAVEKLPHMLAEEFPDAPLLLFYLPDEAAGGGPLPAAEEEAAAPRDLFEDALKGGRVLVAMPETAVADGVRELLRRSFEGDRRLLGRLSALFTEMAQKAPIELEPGVVLLHAHVPEVEEPLLFFGARPQGFRILALEEPARVLVVLCAPEGQLPEAHLAVLGEIARLFKERSLARRLLEAKRPADLENAEKGQPR